MDSALKKEIFSLSISTNSQRSFARRVKSAGESLLKKMVSRIRPSVPIKSDPLRIDIEHISLEIGSSLSSQKSTPLFSRRFKTSRIPLAELRRTKTFISTSIVPQGTDQSPHASAPAIAYGISASLKILATTAEDKASNFALVDKI